ncbi:MAG TPA: 2OG-Fe(II) oxygenase [Kofleriaceae bacterium]|nr:2OG-Fe(II) oxygenase [Kofleriaceae bacterium]
MIVPGSGRRYFDGDSLDHTAPLVFTLADVLRPDECMDMIARVEQLGFEDAPITTLRGFEMRPDVRNNKRVMLDDTGLAAELFGRLGGAIPPRLFGRRAVGVNERFRCYRYEPEQRFAPHYDGAYTRSPVERSELTLMVYLNDEFTGGRTAFHDFDVEVAPRTGIALLFQHRLLHEGCIVRSGVKYVLRSDVMYAE